MKNSNELMDTFLSLDKNEHIPFMLTLRLLADKKCRTQVRLMTKAEKIASEPLKIQVPLNDTSIEAVLKQINPDFNEAEAEKSPISLSRWIVAGLIMILLLLIFGIITRRDSSQVLMLCFSLLFAGAVTAYCALFVGCNMDFFVKKIETRKFAL